MKAVTQETCWHCGKPRSQRPGYHSTCDGCLDGTTRFEELLPIKLAQIDRDAQRKKDSLVQRAKDLQTLKDNGIKIEYIDMSCYRINIKREDLPKLRRIVGPMEVIGKDPSGDFDKTQMLSVSLQAKSGFTGLRFTYPTPYKPGGKCHVVTNAYTSRTLVCKR